MTIAPFSFSDWSTAYPEFATTVNSVQAALLFAQAGLYLNNTDTSLIVADPVTFQPRQALLYLITSHLAQLQFGSSKAAASPIVGRIDAAAEGSVNIHADMPNTPEAAAWWLTTQYGAAYWNATRQYRTAVYIPRPGFYARRGYRGGF